MRSISIHNLALYLCHRLNSYCSNSLATCLPVGRSVVPHVRLRLGLRLTPGIAMLSTGDRHVMTGTNYTSQNARSLHVRNPSFAAGLVSRHLGLKTEMTISDDEDKLSSGLNIQCVLSFVQDYGAPNSAKRGT